MKKTFFVITWLIIGLSISAAGYWYGKRFLVAGFILFVVAELFTRKRHV